MRLIICFWQVFNRTGNLWLTTGLIFGLSRGSIACDSPLSKSNRSSADVKNPKETRGSILLIKGDFESPAAAALPPYENKSTPAALHSMCQELKQMLLQIFRHLDRFWGLSHINLFYCFWSFVSFPPKYCVYHSSHKLYHRQCWEIFQGL